MVDEKIVTPVVAPAAVITQAIPAMVDATMAVGAVTLSQAPAMTATDVKPVVDKPSSVVAATVVEQK